MAARIELEESLRQIDDLKRDGNLEEALTLALRCVAQTEQDAAQTGESVRSAPYQQAAVILHKLKRISEERQVLERFVCQRRSGSNQAIALRERLLKLYAKTGVDLATVEASPMFTRVLGIVDTETTGYGKFDQPIEVAISQVQTNLLTGRITGVLARYSGLRDPGIPIPPDATRVHGLSANDVRGKRLDDQMVTSLLGQCDALLAHNAAFDRRMLRPLFPFVASMDWYCSMNGIDWKERGHSSKSLAVIMADHDIGTQGHRAAGDVDALLELLGRTDPVTGMTYLATILDHGLLSREMTPEPSATAQKAVAAHRRSAAPAQAHASAPAAAAQPAESRSGVSVLVTALLLLVALLAIGLMLAYALR